MSENETTIDVTAENIETTKDESVKESSIQSLKSDLSDFMNDDNPVYKTIPYLAFIPKQVRDNKKSRYCYPEEYQNKIYRSKDKFILFNESSYTEVPFGMVYLLSQVLSSYNNSTTISELNNNYTDLQVISESIENCLNKYEEVIQNQDLIVKQLDAISNATSSISELLTEHEQRFNSIQDILKTIDISQFAEAKTEISKIIENYSSTNSDLGQSFDNLVNDLKSIKSRLDNIENISHEKNNIDISTLDLSEYVNISMFKMFKENIEKQFSVISNQIAKIPSSSENSFNSKLTIEELSKLKEAGYSSEEIYQLKILKLI